MAVSVMTTAEYDARLEAARNLRTLADQHPDHAARWQEIGLSLLLDPAMPRSAAELLSEEA